MSESELAIKIDQMYSLALKGNSEALLAARILEGKRKSRLDRSNTRSRSKCWLEEYSLPDIDHQ